MSLIYDKYYFALCFTYATTMTNIYRHIFKNTNLIDTTLYDLNETILLKYMIIRSICAIYFLTKFMYVSLCLKVTQFDKVVKVFKKLLFLNCVNCLTQRNVKSVKQKKELCNFLLLLFMITKRYFCKHFRIWWKVFLHFL